MRESLGVRYTCTPHGGWLCISLPACVIMEILRYLCLNTNYASNYVLDLLFLTILLSAVPNVLVTGRNENAIR